MLKIDPFAFVTTQDLASRRTKRWRARRHCAKSWRSLIARILKAFGIFRVFQGCSRNHFLSCTKPLARPFWLSIYIYRRFYIFFWFHSWFTIVWINYVLFQFHRHGVGDVVTYLKTVIHHAAAHSIPTPLDQNDLQGLRFRAVRDRRAVYT